METVYEVRGPSCAICLMDLMESVRGVPGVDTVAIDVVRDGTSSLTVHTRVTAVVGTVSEVVRNAGFLLWADERLDEMEVSE